MDRLGLGPVGVALTVSGSYLSEAAELEALGYSALWLQLRAGADHVILHVLTEDGQPGAAQVARDLRLVRGPMG